MFITTPIGATSTNFEKPNQTKYKHARIRSFVSSGLNRIGCLKDGKTLKYLGVESFETVVDHIQNQMYRYNTQYTGKKQISFTNMELDHIKFRPSFESLQQSATFAKRNTRAEIFKMDGNRRNILEDQCWTPARFYRHVNGQFN